MKIVEVFSSDLNHLPKDGGGSVSVRQVQAFYRYGCAAASFISLLVSRLIEPLRGVLGLHVHELFAEGGLSHNHAPSKGAGYNAWIRAC